MHHMFEDSIAFLRRSLLLQVDSNSQQLVQPIITEDQVDHIGDLPQVSATIKPLLAQEANPALVKIKIKNVQTSSLGDRVVDSCSPLHSD